MDLPILLSCGTLYLHNASDNFPVQGFNIQAVLVMLCIQLQANAKVPLEPLSMRSPDACACFPGLPGEGQVTVTNVILRGNSALSHLYQRSAQRALIPPRS